MDERTQERYKRNIQKVANLAISQVSGDLDLSYYDETYRNAFCNFERSDTAYIGSYCVMVPDEIIYALGYTPLRLCAGHQISALLGEEKIPRDACPVVKASVGFHDMQILPMYNQCEVAIMPMTCEAKRKSVEVLTKNLPVIPLSIPMTKDMSNMSHFQETVDMMMGLIKTLEIQTGKKVSRKALKQACLDVNAAQEQAYLLQQKLYAANPQIKGSEVMYAINSFCYTSPQVWEEETKKLIALITKKEQAAQSGLRPKPRVFIAGSPISFPNMKLPLLIEELGGQIVGDESCLSGRLLYDPVMPNDFSKTSIVRALTARYISACTCPVFDNIDDRHRSLKTRFELSNTEGIIYHVLRGCVPHDFELVAIEKLANELDIPILRVETDFSTEDVEQVKIRFEAFIEMIEQRRRSNG